MIAFLLTHFVVLYKGGKEMLCNKRKIALFLGIVLAVVLFVFSLFAAANHTNEDSPTFEISYSQQF
jgi:hypothetical protein